jgi:hypothetical protein
VIFGGNHFLIRLLLCFLLFSLASGCKKRASSKPESAILASVDGVDIRASDFDEYYIKHLIATGKNDTRENRDAFLNDLTHQLLLGNEGLKSGIDAQPEFQTFERIQLKKALRDYFFLYEMEKNPIAIPEEEVRQAYVRSKSKRVVRQLYFTSRAEAENYVTRLKQGESFVKLANELYRTPAFDSTAGLLGEIGYFSVDDAFAEAVFSLPADSSSGIIQSKWGLHIVKVDKVITPAMLAEDQFIAAKKGVESQVRLRKQRRQGDAFVKAFMEATNPIFNEPLMKRMALFLKQVHAQKMTTASRDAQPDMIRFEQADMPAIFGQFNSNDVLATFEIDGKRLEMTVETFASWLPDLLPSEVTNRFGASVGRALRNEALAAQGRVNGLEKDARLVHDLALRKQIYASDLFASRVIAGLDTASVKPDSARFAAFMQREATFGYQMRYWYKNVESMAAAAQQQRQFSGLTPENLKKNGFTFVETRVQYGAPLFKIMHDNPAGVLSAGIDAGNTPVLVYIVSKKEALENTQNAEYRMLYLKKLAMDRYLDSLRSRAVIQVDTAAFRARFVLETN